jgi:hypothetical protein
MVAMQKTTPRPAAANPDVLIIASLLWCWDGSVVGPSFERISGEV